MEFFESNFDILSIHNILLIDANEQQVDYYKRLKTASLEGNYRMVEFCFDYPIINNNKNEKAQ